MDMAIVEQFQQSSAWISNMNDNHKASTSLRPLWHGFTGSGRR